MKCRGCHGEKTKLILDLGYQPWGNDFRPIENYFPPNSYPLQLFYCHDCSLVQLGHTIPKESMFVDHAYLSGSTKALKRHFDSISKAILDRWPLSSKDLILDIGGNDGSFLSFFKECGVRCLNVDSGRLQAAQSELNKVPCLNKFFNESLANEILQNYGPCKVIHGAGILFHLEELHSVFRGIKLLLENEGTLVAQFIYLPDMVRNLAYDQIYHEHLVYYSIRSFNRLLKSFDLEIFDAEISPIHGGSCIAFITHYGTRQRTLNLNRLEELEVESGFDDYQIYEGFAAGVIDSASRLKKIIADLKAQGKTIQALGAPVKGSTLLNYSGLSEKELDCAVEINPFKCNTFYPGTRIPVFHQDLMLEPDVYLLLSWNFKEDILASIESFRKRGGQVLIPIPRPYLV